MSNLLIYQYFRDPVLDDQPHEKPWRQIMGTGYHKLSKQSISKYAEKCNVEYKFLDHYIGYSTFYGIFLPFLEYWAHDYDAVCFVDSDVLATVNFENVFTHMQPDCVNISLTGTKSNNEWLDQQGGIANSGVVIFPKNIYGDITDFVLNNINKNSGRGKWGNWDQLIINRFLVHSKKVNNLPKQFNWHMGKYSNDKNSRCSQTLIHYHGKFKVLIETEFHDECILK